MCVLGNLAWGKWSKPAWQALKNGAVSINPAELVMCAAAIHVGIKADVLREGMWVVWRTDNDAAVCDWNRQRARSAAMLEALRIVSEVASAKGIEVFARHVPKAVNSIADLLSRNRVKLATDLSQKEFKNATRIPIGKLVDNWMARIIRAAQGN